MDNDPRVASHHEDVLRGLIGFLRGPQRDWALVAHRGARSVMLLVAGFPPLPCFILYTLTLCALKSLPKSTTGAQMPVLGLVWGTHSKAGVLLPSPPQGH